MSDHRSSIANLSPEEKRELLAKLLLEKSSRPQTFPLSMMQEPLWLLDQLELGSPFYNIPAAVRLSGRLNVAVLRQSLDFLVRRHAALRTTFVGENGRAVQRVVPRLQLDLPIDDLRALDPRQREGEIQRRSAEEARRPFDLANGPLLRVRLLWTAETEHLFLLCLHHIISDGASLAVFIREMGTLYDAFSAGRSNPLPELTVQYGDYAVWQRSRLRGEAIRRQRAYWRTQLDGAPGGLELPTDPPPVPVDDYAGATELFEASAGIRRRLAALARGEGVTLFMAALAALKVLMCRFAGQEDVVLGTPIAGRTRAEIEGLIGLFVNTLVLRTDLSGNPTFRELLARVRKTTLDAYASQDVPFEDLVKQHRSRRKLGSNPLFNVLFNFLNVPQGSWQLAGLTVSPYDLHETLSKFPATFYMQDDQQQLRFRLVYQQKLFSSQRIRHWLRQFAHLLEQIVEDPTRPILAYSLVTADAARAIPNPGAELPCEWSEGIAERFSRHARHNPERTAVVDRHGSWSYARLEARANQLAWFLKDGGISTGDLVGVYAHRDASLVWALLGILKAGAAFMILDADYPADRLAVCLHGAQPRGWIELASADRPPKVIQDALAELPLRGRLTLSQGSGDRQEDVLNDCSTCVCPVAVGPDDRAYVASTSGTTGRPKLIEGTHRPLGHFLQWHTQTFGLEATDRFSLLSGLSHDPLLRDVFTPLWLGATLCIPEPDDIGSQRLVEWMRQQEISVSHLTPAMGQLLCLSAESRPGQSQQIPSLREVFFGGDVLTRRQVSAFEQLAPNTRITNFYGATETPQAMGYCTLPDDQAVGEEGVNANRQRIPLGRGIRDVQLLVVNAAGQLCGVGELGEIWVRTPYLAAGYLDHDQAARQPFAVNPFTDRPDDRVYRTGDLGRYLPDGQVEFAGRRDRQVKIRGFRIELEEVESVLGSHPRVAAAAVTAWETGGGDRQLAGYFVSADESSPGPAELRDYLLPRLPEYMVPAVFVELEELPLLPNGKLDRRALPAPDPSQQQLQREYVAPRTQMEELLSGIWSEVLGVERVGVLDNFFELGGHSLLAVQVISRVRRRLEVELPLRKLFEEPTVAAVAGLLEKLPGESPSAAPIPRADRQGELPLSFAQERLWFLDQWEPGSSFYNIPASFRVRGELDFSALGRSLDAMAARHEVLRTVFRSRQGRPRQEILPELQLDVSLVDLSGLPAQRRESEALRRVTEQSRRPFDLSEGPLLRTLLVRLTPTDHVFLLCVHHIISDAWSMGVLVREMVALYEGYRRGKEPSLGELPVQYADYTLWQRNLLSGELLGSELSYWQQQLSGAPQALELPTDHPRPAVPSYRGGRYPVEFSAELSESLRMLSRQEGVTLFMTLLAAWEVLLGRYSGQDQVCVGTPVAGRNRAELEGLIGFFVNTLVLRGDLSQDPTFTELLRQTYETTMGAYAHQELPFEHLVEHLQPERRLNRNPLFQVMLVLQNVPREDLEVAGLTFSPLPLAQETSKFDLSLSLVESQRRLTGRMDYNSELFEAATIERMVGQLQTLLREIVADPRRRVSQLPLLAEAQRRRLLVDWRGDRTERPAHGCVHQLFEAQAAATPEATALVFEDRQLTYRQLNARANRLAHHLRKLGVGPDQLVGLCVDRSPEMIVGLLGILKSGGAYLPLDPHYPAGRLHWMLADSGARIVVGESAQRKVLQRCEAEVICLDEAEDTLGDCSAEDPRCLTRPEHLAYVIYTSGSTGRPKGVLIEHRGVCNLVAGQSAAWEVTAADRILQFASISFDASVSDVFVSLCCGATLVLARREELMSDRGLLDLLQNRQCTLVKLPPSMLSLLPEAELPSLRVMISAGESCRGESVRRWAPGRRFFNVYGPTEGTVCATLAECRADEERFPIGRPLPNVEVYVLDRQLQPVPIGVPGELCIGGVGLARGYLNRPELTAEKFVANPFGDAPGSRLYRTGDLVRYLPDGNLEHLGRLDQQVKVRGFRIEPGEIESVLSGYDEVRQAAVIARDTDGGMRQLVAYVVASGEVCPSVEQLRDYLRNRLPEYMVPSVFVPLNALPLLPNGKLDRRALPAPDASQRQLQREYVAPRTQAEELLSGIWSEVLGVERVGVLDDFFELGGHSLLAVQVVSRVRQRLEVELPLRKLFEEPTLAALAKAIEAAEAGGQTSGDMAIPLTPRDGELPLSFAQQRFWYLDQLQPGNPAYNVFRYFQLDGPFDCDVAQRAFREIVRRHEIMRTTFRTVGGRPIQVIAPSVELDVEWTDLSDLAEDDRDAEVWRRIGAEGRIPFDLSEGPLFRVRLLRLEEQRHVMLVTKHHIISDGWSVRVLIHELATLYEAFKAGRPSPLGELPIQYADFAVWQRRWLEGEVLARQLDYWREKLKGLAPLELPTDRPRSRMGKAGGATEHFSVSDACMRALYELARREGVTPFMTLLAAFKVLLYRYSGEEDVAVGSTIANRNQVGTESLIGFFVNTVVLRTDLSADPTFRELLARVRESALGAYEHEDLPFERLVEELNPPREARRNPLFSILVNYPRGRASVEELRPPRGIRAGPVETRQESRRRSVRPAPGPFDLSLTLRDGEDGFHGHVDYNTGLFDAETVLRLIGHYRTLLEAVAADPEVRISDMPLMDEPEEHCVLSRFNDTAAGDPPDTSVCQRFETEAGRAPQAPAVVCGQSQMTYGELNERANRLARYLISRGVGPNVPVGICLERSAELLVAVWGVVKAGGAYVPLDPAYSKESQDRVAFTLQDAGVSLLIGRQELIDTLGEVGVETVALDSGWPEISTHSPENLPRRSSAEDLAYVIYTSGSTGRPKGVMVTQGNLLNAYLGWEEAYELRTAARSHLQMASFCFDVFTGDMVRALCSGGKLVICPQEILLDPEPLLELMRREEVDCAEFVPVVLRNLLDHLERTGESLDFMRLVITGSDTWYVSDHLRAQAACGPRTRLINSYGLTETTIDSSFYEGAVEGMSEGGLVPIGRPLRNTRTYVLDQRRRPVPIGVPGELYIGGSGVARGYRNRAELTAERFLPDPYAREAGARMCKTGDLVRWRADGQLEFLGRTDHQVKIRGFRIEPGEVEAVLNDHPAVSAAVVVAREDAPGAKQLVGYLVVDDAPPSVEGLRGFLGRRLPKYMIPSALVVLEALPITANGKVDLKALPAPDPARSGLGDEYVAPRNETEERLAAIWADVLKLDRVGIHNDFFSLGGHSLLAVQVVSRVREAFEVRLPLVSFFAAPTVAGQAEALADEALESPSVGKTTIPRVSREGELPLSFAQQRFWFFDQLEPGNPAYNMHLAVQLSGELDVDALKRTFDELVLRHESLRTRFCAVDGRPVQVIMDSQSLALCHLDLNDLPQTDRDAEIRRRLYAEARFSFDLSTGPLVRAALLRLSDKEHVLSVTVHHVISDAWSVRVLVGEVGALYQAFCAGLPSPLPPLPIQYVDYAVWQQKWLQGDVLDEQLTYWRRQLEGLTPLDLPTDRPRTARGRHGEGIKSFDISPMLSTTLYEFGRRERVTPFMIFLAAYQILLHRYARQDDVATCSPIANRNQVGTEGVLGFFVNTLVLRSDLSGNPTFRKLLAQVRQTTLEAYDHEDLPFERLVEELQPVRDVARHPLSQVLVNFINRRAAPRTELRLPELTLGPVKALEGYDTRRGAQGPFDLVLTLTETDQRIRGSIGYDTALFDAETVARMVNHYQTLLEVVAADPERRISDLPLMDEPEEHCVLSRFNDTAAGDPPDTSVCQLFETEAGRAPQAPAVVCGQSQMTYGELNERANRLARYLISRGVGPSVPVGICLERSAELLVAVWGVMKAGGAYVPLDPAYSKESQDRVAFTLQDAGVSLLIGRQELIDTLGEVGVETVALDSDWPEISTHSPENLPRRSSAEDLAYVIYTSGSTGRPKGVMVTQGNLLNAYLGWEEAYELRTAARSHLQMASFCFDVFTGDMVRALCSGGKLVICPQEILLDPEPLLELMRREEVDCAEFVPVVLRNLLDHLERTGESLDFMRLVITGSDTWYVSDHLRAQAACGPRTRLINSYGLTETTIDSSFYEGAVEGMSEGGLVPIGRPLRNTRTYVLDQRRRPVPIGVPGELYIGGSGVARGYRNRAELTAERFLPDPYAREAGARMCKTGDLVRWRADGQLEFLGRTDHQVKIRGFRIEPGEVEAVLNDHPALGEVAVVVREDTPGMKRLVAYAVPHREPAPSVEELRGFLGQRLPSYMVPSAFVALGSLPKTNSGKVDRRALPAPDPTRTELHGEYAAPRNEVEQRLASIWAEALGLDQVGIHDDFFELGGHSLLVVQVVSRVRNEFAIDLPLARLFTSPTVAGLAQRVEAAIRGDSTMLAQDKAAAKELVAAWLVPGSKSTSPLVAVQPHGSKRPLFCVHGLGGHVSLFEPLAEQLGTDQPFYGLRAQGLNGREEPHRRIEDMAACYIEEIRTVQLEGPYLLGGWSMGGVIALEMAQQLAAAGRQTDLVAMLDTHRPNRDRISRGLDDAVIMRWISERLGFSLQDLELLPSEDPWEFVLEQARDAGLVPAEVGVDQLRGLAQVCKAHVTSLGSYVARSYPGPVFVFRASATSDKHQDEDGSDWNTLLGDVKIRRIPGGHLSMLRSPHVDTLAAELAACLAAVQTPNYQTS